MAQFILRCDNVEARIDAGNAVLATRDPLADAAPVGAQILREGDRVCLAERKALDAKHPNVAVWMMTAEWVDDAFGRDGGEAA